MAYNVIPSTYEELGKAVRNLNSTSAVEATRLWTYLVESYGQVIGNPIAFDPGQRNKCKVARALSAKFTKAEIKRQLKIKDLNVDFGDGSRGNRGSGNRGKLFEFELQQGLQEWIDTNELSTNKYRDFIYGLVNHYNLEDCQGIGVREMGSLDQKRPMKIVNGHWEIGTASRANGYDIGATVTDLDLDLMCHGKKRTVHLSLKTSGTTTLSNLGVKKEVFPVAQIKAGKIETTAGIALMRTFGLDENNLCETFNKYQAGGRDFHIVDNAPNYDRGLLKELLKGSIGYGFHYVHLMRGTIKHLEIDEQFLERAANVSTVQVAYGGETGGAKRVNINVTTPELDLSFNIRNTSDKGTTEDPDRVYPDKLQSAYKMKGEPIQTVFSDD